MSTEAEYSFKWSEPVSGAPQVDHLAITCMDCRFRPKFAEWLNSMVGKADLLAVPGPARQILATDSQRFVLRHIELMRRLHGVSRVHLVGHQDCGAYGGSGEFKSLDQEIEAHAEDLIAAAEIITKWFPDIEVDRYFASFEGIRKLG